VGYVVLAHGSGVFFLLMDVCRGGEVGIIRAVWL
jgi:hypothetical protein